MNFSPPPSLLVCVCSVSAHIILSSAPVQCVTAWADQPVCCMCSHSVIFSFIYIYLLLFTAPWCRVQDNAVEGEDLNMVLQPNCTSHYYSTVLTSSGSLPNPAMKACQTTLGIKRTLIHCSDKNVWLTILYPCPSRLTLSPQLHGYSTELPQDLYQTILFLSPCK